MASDSDNCQHRSQQCPSYCQTAYKGYPQASKQRVGVRLSCHNMYDICMETLTIEEYCDWSEVTHIVVTCLGVSRGEPCWLDANHSCLKSASTYMPCFDKLKEKFPHLQLVLSFDPAYYFTQLPDALLRNPYAFFRKLGGYLKTYGFDGVELNFKLFLGTTSRDVETAICQTDLHGKIYMIIGGDVDFTDSRNIEMLNLFGMFSCCVIVNTFGFFQYKTFCLPNGTLKLLQPLSDRKVEHVRSLLLTVLSCISEKKIMLGFSNEAVVFELDGPMIKNVYETTQKEVEMLKTAEEKIAQLKKEGLFLAYDKYNESIEKLGMVKRYNLAGFICGDLWNDLPPNATHSFMSLALRFFI